VSCLETFLLLELMVSRLFQSYFHITPASLKYKFNSVSDKSERESDTRFSAYVFLDESVSLSPGPLVSPWGHFKFLRKFVKIFTTFGLSLVSSLTLAKRCLPVQMTLAINYHHASLLPAKNGTGDYAFPRILSIPWGFIAPWQWGISVSLNLEMYVLEKLILSVYTTTQ
jgi:hypothetical protein